MTEEERILLYNWSIYMKNKYKISKYNPLIHISELNSIPLVYEIKKRIELKENIQMIKEQLTMGLEASDFIAFIENDNCIMKHTDQNCSKTNTYQIRFNVIISNPKNSCTTYYAGNIVDIKERIYVLCKSGIDTHWTDINTELIPRISLSFCYFIPIDKINELN